jgi:hypothetical protein
MTFTVIWVNRAEQELANVWLNASDPAAITAAADRIDRLLQRDPLGVGESRAGPNRILFEGPLGVLYQVIEPTRTVLVLSVGRAGRTP